MSKQEDGGKRKSGNGGEISRRTLLYGVGGAAALLGLGGLRILENYPIIRPPGGQDEERLVSACVHCEKCYEICPRNVIAPGHLEDGILNIRTPTLNFKYNWCDWCISENGGHPLCVQVCPTDALKLPDDAEPWSEIIGIAAVGRDRCLALKLMGCLSCYDACPYDAMTYDEYKRPIVLEDVCVGCGACQSACVSMTSGSVSNGITERAILVHPLDDNGQLVIRRSHRI